MATAGEGPHISNASDICAVEQRGERLGAQRAVPDGAHLGQDGRLCGRALMMPEYRPFTTKSDYLVAVLSRGARTM